VLSRRGEIPSLFTSCCIQPDDLSSRLCDIGNTIDDERIILGSLASE
jgi:hypothetical protein